MQKLGDLFREKREAHDLLLRQAAAKLDMDAAVLSKIERNDRRATKEQLQSISTLYELDYDNLLVRWNTERVIDLLTEEKDQNKIITELNTFYAKK